MQWLTSTKYAQRVEQIRAVTDKAERDKMKATLPTITASGLFRVRESTGLIQHSGLIALDIDAKDNQHIGNYADLKAQLCQIKNVAYCGLSVSGTGYFLLIPITQPDQHGQHFDALKRLFLQTWEIVVDKSCRDVSRLRGYSYDVNGFFRHDAAPFAVFDVPPPAKAKTFAFTPDADRDRQRAEDCISQVVKRCIDLAPNYADWFALGQSLANGFGESGRDYFHQLSQFNAGYKPIETDGKYSGCLKSCDRVTLATFFNLCKSAGIVASAPITHHAPAPAITRPIVARPNNTWILDGRMIHGEILPDLTQKRPANPIPSIISGLKPLTRGQVFDVARLARTMWSDYPNPPLWWCKITAHKIIQRVGDSGHVVFTHRNPPDNQTQIP